LQTRSAEVVRRFFIPSNNLKILKKDGIKMPSTQDVLLYKNPCYLGLTPPGALNPRKKHRRSNPNILGGVKKFGNTFFGGLNIMEMVGTVGDERVGVVNILRHSGANVFGKRGIPKPCKTS
jgi:hypothetical protein